MGYTQPVSLEADDGDRRARDLARRRQQLEVLRETALVTVADGIDRRAHRGHDELLRRDSLPARRPAQAGRPRGAAPLTLHSTSLLMADDPMIRIVILHPATASDAAKLARLAR